MPAYWQQIQDPDPIHSWAEVKDSYVAILNDGSATGVPVWASFDDMLPGDILSLAEAAGESPEDYLRRLGGSPFFAGATPKYPRFDWRPNQGNVRFAWRFYTLQNTTSNGGSGQFIYPGCQEQYFWRLHLLSDYTVPHEGWTLVTADYINGKRSPPHLRQGLKFPG